jgi:hypothetical protein
MRLPLSLLLLLPLLLLLLVVVTQCVRLFQQQRCCHAQPRNRLLQPRHRGLQA